MAQCIFALHNVGNLTWIDIGCVIILTFTSLIIALQCKLRMYKESVLNENRFRFTEQCTHKKFL